MKSLETLDLETLKKVRKSLQIIMEETKFTEKDLVKPKTQFQTNIAICYLMVERTILENLKKNNNMTKYLIYREYSEPYVVEHKLAFQTFDEKIHFAKQLLVNLSAVQVEFEHAGSRYTIEFDIQNTL